MHIQKERRSNRYFIQEKSILYQRSGGAIYAHPMSPTAGARAFRQGIDLIMAGKGFNKSLDDYPELKASIDQWGIYEQE